MEKIRNFRATTRLV